jgi:hypothetical protein
MSDLDQLKMMGFDADRASIALKQGGNRSCFPAHGYLESKADNDIVNGAIDWLETNADKTIEEIQAEVAAAAETDTKITTTSSLESGVVAMSYVCGECGKKFRNMTEVQFHANKR